MKMAFCKQLLCFLIALHCCSVPHVSGQVAQISTITFHRLSPPFAETPVFTLRCTSTGGPVASLTWSRDDIPLTNTGPLVLDDRKTSTYHNVLEVTGRVPGFYSCQIRDNSGSIIHAMNYNVKATNPVTDVQAVAMNMSGSLTVDISWSPPKHFIGSAIVTAYRIYYTSSGVRKNISVAPGADDDDEIHFSLELGGDPLDRGEVSIRAESEELPSSLVIVTTTSILINITSSGTNIVGEQYNLTCETDTADTPKITWSEPRPRPHVGDTRRMFYTSPHTKVLQFSKLQSSHEGMYICQVTVGTVTGMRSVQVNVTEPPINVTINASGTPTVAGQSPSLTCIVTGADRLNPTITYQWFKNNTVVSDETQPTLSFSSLRLSDAGQYRCDVTVNSTLLNQSISAMSNNQDLIVQIPTPDVTITVPNTPLYIGMNDTLTCTITLIDYVDMDVMMEVTWLRSGTPLSNTTSRVTISPLAESGNTTTSNLTLSPLRFVDNTSFTCKAVSTPKSQRFVAASDVGNNTIILSVQVPNQLIFRGVSYPNNSVLSLNDIGEYSTGSAILCTTDRRPCCRSNQYPSNAKFRFGEWYYPNGTALPKKSTGEDFYRGRLDNGTIYMNHRNNAQSPTGSYCCELPDSSDVNHTLCVTLVSVSITPSGTNTAGEYYELTCTVTGSTDTSTIKWLDPSSNLLLPSQVGDTRMASNMMSSGSTHTSILRFDPLQASHEGTYTCQVIVETLTEIRSIQVNVEEPSITAAVNSSGTPTVAGQGYSLTCTVTGANRLNPTITYQWFKDNTVVSSETQSTLFFSSLRLSDAGQYRCDVNISSTLLSRDINETSGIHDHIVQIPPPTAITISQTPNGTAFAHIFLTLTCTIELSEAVDIPVTVNTLLSGPSGKPFPSVARKTRDGTYTSTATFSSALSSNSGEFSCKTDISSTHPLIRNSNTAIGTKSVQEVIQRFQLKLKRTDDCITWNSNKAEEIRTNIRAELHQAIISMSQYDLPAENLLSGVFSCQDAHDQTTYRSTIIGTQSYNATELVGFIQDWVNSGPTLTIQWYAVKLDPNCTVSISSLGDPECKQTN